VSAPFFFTQYNTYTPALNSSGPFVYTSVQPSAAPAPSQYYVSNCGTGAIVQLSRAGASPQSATVLGTLLLSPDNKWVAFTSNANNALLNDIFALPADGSTDPVNVIPALQTTQVRFGHVGGDSRQCLTPFACSVSRVPTDSRLTAST
jgi:hypothetical protein